MLRLMLLVFCLGWLFAAQSQAAERFLPPDAARTIQNALTRPAPLPGATLEGISVEASRATLRFSRQGRLLTAFLGHPDAHPGEERAGGFSLHLNPDPGLWPTETLVALRQRVAAIDPAIWQDPTLSADPASMAHELIVSAEHLMDRDDNALAGRILGVARRLKPEAPGLAFALARLSSQSGDAEGSRRAALMAPLTDGAEARAALEAVRRELLTPETPDPAAALDSLRLIAPQQRRRDADDPPCEVEGIARLLDGRGQGALAARVRAELLAAYPHCAASWNGLGSHLLREGQADTLMTLAEKALAAAPDAPDALLQKARALRRMGRIAEAMPIFERLHELTGDPRMVTLFSTLASQNPRDDAAFARIRTQAEADPPRLPYRHALGVLSYYRGDYETSRRLMDELHALLPKDPRIYIYAAMSRYELGDWEGARRWLGELERLEDSDPDVWYCLAILYHERDRPRALAYLDRYLADPPDPDEYSPKRERALAFRAALAAGKPIPDWQPHASGKKTVPEQGGCRSTGIPGGLAGLLAGLGALAGLRRRRVC